MLLAESYQPVLKRKPYLPDRSAAGSTIMQMDWDDYRDIGGLMLPFKIREAGTENWLIQCTEVKRNEPIDDATFARPAH